jgi:hypothetical protein
MAVYTLINKSQLESLLAYYDIGELVEYSPIVAGTTNSNYKLNVINKNNNQSNNKNSYAANQNQGKDSSPISYLKNFKKTYSKANQ